MPVRRPKIGEIWMPRNKAQGTGALIVSKMKKDSDGDEYYDVIVLNTYKQSRIYFDIYIRNHDDERAWEYFC